MINVKVIESDALLVTSQTYTYVDFEDLSEDLTNDDTVRFVLSENDVDLFEGLFVKEQDYTVHQYISLKIQQMVMDGKVKKRKGKELLRKLDKEFSIPDEKANDKEIKSPPLKIKSKKETIRANRTKGIKKPKPKKERSIEIKSWPWKKIGTGIVVILISISIVFLGMNFLNSKGSSDANRKEAFETLITEEKYNQAAKEYPNRIKDIEQEIVKSKDFEALEKFNDKYPTAEGKFDLAFNLKNWEAVIETDQSTLTKDRQVMLAYAYIQLDRLDEADILNKKLTSKKLSEALKAAYKKRAIKLVQQGKFKEAEEINERIDDKDLFEIVQTGKSCQEMIEYYSEKKDKANEETWRNRLENLGKDLIEK